MTHEEKYSISFDKVHEIQSQISRAIDEHDLAAMKRLGRELDKTNKELRAKLNLIKTMQKLDKVRRSAGISSSSR